MTRWRRLLMRLGFRQPVPVPLTTREIEVELLLRGIIGLVQMVRRRDDVGPELRSVLYTNHRMVDACEFLGIENE